MTRMNVLKHNKCLILGLSIPIKHLCAMIFNFFLYSDYIKKLVFQMIIYHTNIYDCIFLQNFPLS